jgi:tetratricopeptide (TPR) repeat protein
MKKILLVMLMAVASMACAQVKPSIPKTEKALKDGNLAEAKSIIDATTSSQEFMVDKKGKPSKNAAKAWYLKAMVYFAIDTTKKAEFKKLDPNPFAVAKEAFDKSHELDPDPGSVVNDPKTGFPILDAAVKNTLANAYYNAAITSYNQKTEDKDLRFANVKAAFDMAEKTLYFVPKDTSVLLYTGGVFAPFVKEYEKGIQYLKAYVANGGKMAEAYTMMAQIYQTNLKDNASALKVIEEGKAKYPNYKDLSLMELNIYLSEKKYDLARTRVEAELKADPNSVTNNFLNGQLNRELGESDKAKEAFKKVLELDPKNFDAAAELANLYWNEAKKFKDEMGKLGNSKADMAKLKTLDAQYVEKLKMYTPYIEACEKLSPDDVTVLYSLLNVYGDLGEDAKVARVKKRLKALGEDVN